MSTDTTSIARDRQAAVAATLNRVRALAAGSPTRATLAWIASELAVLALRSELFPRSDFPPPEATQGVGASTRYRLNPQDGDRDIALYLNSINPGKSTLPHNHDTWAVIVALEGEEENRIYRRTDDGSRPGYARLEVERQVTVQPGTPITFLPQDLHSIHVSGDRPTLHFHLYGRPLETLSGRVAVNLQTGEVSNYNATQFTSSREAA